MNNIGNYNNDYLIDAINKFNNNDYLIEPISKISNENKLCSGIFKENKKLINPITKIERNSELYSESKINTDKKYISNKYEFIVNSKGDLSVQINHKGLIYLSNFYIIPKKIIIKDDGVYKEKIYLIECVRNNTDKKTIVLTAYDLNNYDWIKVKLGVKYNVFKDQNAYKYFDMYLSFIFEEINEEIEYCQVGWRKISNKYVYLHAGGAIGSNDPLIRGSKDKLIKSLNINQLDSLKHSLTLTNISKNDEKAIMMFVYAHLAVVKELFSLAGVEPKFVLWIYGLTGSMKTSVAKIFFNLFNRDDLSKITATFKDTQASLELKSFEYKDSVLLVDDYHPVVVSSEKKEMQSKASNILRMYGDGISKGRSNKYMQKQAEYPPRGLCVITGEDFIGGESTISRYIGIEVNREEFNEKILSVHQKNPLIFSQHIKYFLLWISKNFEYLLEVIKSQFSVIRNNYYRKFRHPRFGEVYAILNIMIDIIFTYIQNTGYSEKDLTADIWKNKVIKLIQEHEKCIFNEDPAIMYLTAIKELIESGAINISNIGKEKLNKKIFGYEDKEKYYLVPNITFNEVIKFWKNQGIEFPVTEKAVNKALDEIKAIEVTKEINSGKLIVRRTIKKNIEGKISRYLVIYKDIYNKLDIT